MVASDGTNAGSGDSPTYTVAGKPPVPMILTPGNKGQSAAAKITVVVDDTLALPGPTLTAGPTQLGWQFAAGANTPSGRTLEVGNVGSGDLNWTASTDAPWLTLSATSGSDPASLTLTANPSAAPDGSALQGTVTLTAPATGSQSAQTIILPVGLTKSINGGRGCWSAAHHGR